jgi:hypothetical protein
VGDKQTVKQQQGAEERREWRIPFLVLFKKKRRKAFLV